jgi:glycosyltransferase involved in cell wall biosynthesis
VGVPSAIASIPPRARPAARPRPRRVALVHDFLVDIRGAERVFQVMCDLWPTADIFTAVYDEEGTEGRFSGRSVHASFLQRVRPTAGNFRALLPLYPMAMEALDLGDYDLVVSSSSAWAHGVVPADDAVHVCYCHNPFRYAWNERTATLRARSPLVRPVLREILDRWRIWDRRAARRVHRYVANSAITRDRIAHSFARDSAIIHPPVDTDRFAPGEVGDHFLLVSELVSHKRIDVAVRAFNELGRKLVVIGDGPAARRLHHLAGPTVEFVGRVSDARVAELMSSARALVVSAVEEFGIAAVEAQAAGRPAIVPDAGGGRETVVDGATGAFYAAGDTESLAAAIAGFAPEDYDPGQCVANAARFSARRFRRALENTVQETWEGVTMSARRDGHRTAPVPS